MKITPKQLIDYDEKIGESFYEEYNQLLSDKTFCMFLGFLLHKYPKYSKQICTIMNDQYKELFSLSETLDELYLEDQDSYPDFCEFINLTEITRTRINNFLQLKKII